MGKVHKNTRVRHTRGRVKPAADNGEGASPEPKDGNAVVKTVTRCKSVQELNWAVGDGDPFEGFVLVQQTPMSLNATVDVILPLLIEELEPEILDSLLV